MELFNLMHSGAFGDFGMSKETLKAHKNSSYARQPRMRNPSPVATWRFVPSVVWPLGATHSRSSRSAQPESGGHLALRTVRSLMHSYLLPRDRFSKDLTDRFLSKHYAEMRFKSSKNHHILFWGSI